MSTHDHSGFIATSGADTATAVAYLRTPLAIRVRATNVLEAGLLGELRHFVCRANPLKGARAFGRPCGAH